MRHRLRQNDAEKGFAVGVAQRIGRLKLTGIHRGYAGAHHRIDRRAENERFLRWQYKVTGKLRSLKTRWDQRRDYRFFRCPSCRSWLRVPRGKGKLNITCRQCGERFTRST